MVDVDPSREQAACVGLASWLRDTSTPDLTSSCRLQKNLLHLLNYCCFCRSSSISHIKCSSSRKLLNEKVSRVAITYTGKDCGVYKIKHFFIYCSEKFFPNFAGQSGEVGPTMMRHDENSE